VKTLRLEAAADCAAARGLILDAAGSVEEDVLVECPVEDGESPLAWLERQAEGAKLFWSPRDSGEEIAGWGIADILGENGTEESLVGQLQKRLEKLPRGVRYFGGFSFSGNSEGWDLLGRGLFWLPSWQLRRSEQGSVLRCIRWKDGAQMRDSRPFSPPGMSQSPGDAQWMDSFRLVQEALAAGAIEKVVLAMQRHVRTGGSPIGILGRLRSMQNSSFDFLLSPDGEAAFLGCSPERLLRIGNGRIQSEALAGTRPWSGSDERDSEWSTDLLSNEKELWEHQCVVQFIVERLKPFCQGVSSSQKARVVRHNKVQHLLTSIEGRLLPETKLEHLLAAVHPTPAVCGRPEAAAMELIGKLEGFDRGWYAGPVGWIAEGAAEFSVAIRSGLAWKEHCWFWAGAGIVGASKAEDELAEIRRKGEQFSLLEAR
jgi:menaquinone-specific isochorismate synthase